MNNKFTLVIITCCVLVCSGSVTLWSQSPDSDGKAVPDDQFYKARWLKLMHWHQRLSEVQMTDNQQKFDVTYYDLYLDIDTVKQSIEGSVTIAAKITDAPLQFVELDLTDTMTVDSVTAQNDQLSFNHSNDIVRIDLPSAMQTDEFSVTVYYHGEPFAMGFGSFVFWTTGSGNRVVNTLSEPFYARTWWPCKDYPNDKADSADVRVTMDDYFDVVSNGLLVSIIENGDGTNTTHWHESYPITTYLISLACADYYHYSTSFQYDEQTMPVEFYMYPEDWKKYMQYNNAVPEMLGVFSDLFGPYPFLDEKYGHAQFSSGTIVAMEHQTCASMGFFNETVVAHELSHQWWGDMITCGTWKDIWLNEGFATYSEALWREVKYGPDKYHEFINNLSSFNGQLYVENDSSVYAIFSRVVYHKGGFLLHMLRYIVGEQTFFDILKAYGSSSHKYSTAVTTDFQNIAEQVSGQDLSQFFTQWVFETGMPAYQYAYYSIETDSGYFTCFALDQVQKDYSPFVTDIDVMFGFEDSLVVIRIHNNLGRQNYLFLFDSEPFACTLDPYNWILCSDTLVDYTMRILNNELPELILGATYYHQLQVIAGTAPYHWSLVDCELPSGISFTTDGVLSGEAVSPGAYSLLFRATDSADPPNSIEQPYKFSVVIQHGDVDGQYPITLDDVLFLIKYLYRGGAAPQYPEAADVDCDGQAGIVDLVTLLNYIYTNGPPPCTSVPGE